MNHHPVDKQPHLPSRFLVPGFSELTRVVCAVCGAQPNGWWGDGSPRYLGGVLEYERKDGYCFTVACRCGVGQLHRDRTLARFFDLVSSVKTWKSYPHPLIADTGLGEPLPEEVRDYHTAVTRATTRMQRGDLAKDEYDVELRELLRKITPEPPTIADIARSDELRARYFPALHAGVTG